MVVVVEANDRVADVLMGDLADLLDGVGLDVEEQRATVIGAGQDGLQDLPAFGQQARDPRLPLDRADSQHEADIRTLQETSLLAPYSASLGSTNEGGGNAEPAGFLQRPGRQYQCFLNNMAAATSRGSRAGSPDSS